jgi:hypothetical protein
MPRFAEDVYVLEVRAPLEGATATALANPVLGEGGATLNFIPNLDRAIDSGQLVWVRDHQFDPGTLVSRIEDPQFRLIDPDLSSIALDPADARFDGFVEEAIGEFGGTAKQTAMSTGAAAASNYIDERRR